MFKTEYRYHHSMGTIEWNEWLRSVTPTLFLTEIATMQYGGSGYNERFRAKVTHVQN